MPQLSLQRSQGTCFPVLKVFLHSLSLIYTCIQQVLSTTCSQCEQTRPLIIQVSKCQQPFNPYIQGGMTDASPLFFFVAHQLLHDQFVYWGASRHARIPLLLVFHLWFLVDDQIPELPAPLVCSSPCPLNMSYMKLYISGKEQQGWFLGSPIA